MSASPSIGHYTWALARAARLAATAAARPIDHAILSGLLAARIFEVPSDLYERLYAVADETLRHDHALVSVVRDEESFLEYVASRCSAFVGPTPFESTYIHYGPSGVPIAADRMQLMRGITVGDGSRLLGHLIVKESDGGYAIYELLDGSQETWVCRVYHHGWKQPVDAETVCLPELLRLLTEPRNSTRVTLSNFDSHTLRKCGKSIKKVVRKEPYYRINVDLDEAVRVLRRRRYTGPRAEPSHSWDSRAHQRLLVQRGSMPISPTLCLALAHRGYAYWSAGEPGAVWQREMEIRGITAKRPGEWIALKLRPIKACRKKVHLPYLPAVRVVTDQRDSSEAHT